MMTMVVGPPERSALDGRSSPEGEQELSCPGGVVALVREIAVIDAGHREHPHQVEKTGGAHRGPAPTDPEYGEASEVQQDERDTADEVDLVGLSAGCFGSTREVVGINPLDN